MSPQMLHVFNDKLVEGSFKCSFRHEGRLWKFPQRRLQMSRTQRYSDKENQEIITFENLAAAHFFYFRLMKTMIRIVADRVSADWLID